MNFAHAEVATLDPTTMRTLCEEYIANNYIDPETSERLGVKRGLRNPDGTGVLGGSEPTTLKDLSEMLGKETIDAFNTSDTRGNSPSYGTTFQKMGHELLSRDELAVLDGGKCILQLRGVRPFLSDKYDLTQHPNYKYTSDFDKRNEFNIEQFLSRRLKLKAGDEFVVVDAD